VFFHITWLPLIVFIPLLIVATAPSVSGQPTLVDSKFKAEPFVQGLNFPTSMAFLEAGDVLVSEKDNGTIQRIKDSQVLDKPFFDVSVATDGERGLLGIAVLDEESKNESPEYVFMYYTESATANDGDDVSKQKSPLGNRIYRYTFSDGELKDGKMLLDLPADPPPDTIPFHNGGKIIVDSDQNIYVVIGDLNSRRTQGQNIQKGPSPDGTSTIYRITKDGEAADGNPFEDTEGLEKYYAYGIRNSFGMDIDPITGNLWDSENGPDRGDEINLVEPGFNSGALRVYGMSMEENSDSNGLVDLGGKDGYSEPEFTWKMPVGVTAVKFIDSDLYGEDYENDLLVGDVNNGNIYHFELNKDRTELTLEDQLKDKIADGPEQLNNVTWGTGFGSIIDLEIGPDGYVYVMAIDKFHEDSVGTIYRIIPVST
jgi:glucose/arabinose dehydrogenase